MPVYLLIHSVWDTRVWRTRVSSEDFWANKGNEPSSKSQSRVFYPWSVIRVLFDFCNAGFAFSKGNLNFPAKQLLVFALVLEWLFMIYSTSSIRKWYCKCVASRHFRTWSKYDYTTLKFRKIANFGHKTIFTYNPCFLSKNRIQKMLSSQIWRKWAKIVQYLFKSVIFSTKRQQVDMFLSPFKNQVLYFWNCHIL